MNREDICEAINREDIYEVIYEKMVDLAGYYGENEGNASYDLCLATSLVMRALEELGLVEEE